MKSMFRCFDDVIMISLFLCSDEVIMMSLFLSPAVKFLQALKDFGEVDEETLSEAHLRTEYGSVQGQVGTHTHEVPTSLLLKVKMFMCTLFVFECKF